MVYYNKFLNTCDILITNFGTDVLNGIAMTWLGFYAFLVLI